MTARIPLRNAAVSMLSAAFLLVGVVAAAPVQADDYQLDPPHSSFYFKIGHLDISYVYGRFNEPVGEFTLDDDDASFNFTLQTANIDTGVEKRDDHLRSPDFFNAKQFPTITFASTGVTETDDGYEVVGNLTLHGVTKEITVDLEKVGEGKDPWDNYRAGFATEITLKRTDFGMNNMLDIVGDEVTLMISFEGIRQ